MKTNVITSLSLLFAITILVCHSCTMNDKLSKGHSRPSDKQIQADLDSICAEGYKLYVADRFNWIASDSALAHYDIEDFGANMIWQPSDTVWSAFFTDKEVMSCVYELRYNTATDEWKSLHSKRLLSNTEQQLLKDKSIMYRNAFSLYGDSIRYNSEYGQPNIDIVRINDHTIRMYILQGCERPNIIPFGNDYSIDLDNNYNVTAFRRYHRSFIPIPTVVKDGTPTQNATHSHLKDNPYITPTDICNFLLYRGSMTQTSVLSTALNGIIIYNAENNKAIFLSHEVIEKIQKREH